MVRGSMSEWVAESSEAQRDFHVLVGIAESFACGGRTLWMLLASKRRVIRGREIRATPQNSTVNLCKMTEPDLVRIPARERSRRQPSSWLPVVSKESWESPSLPQSCLLPNRQTLPSPPLPSNRTFLRFGKYWVGKHNLRFESFPCDLVIKSTLSTLSRYHSVTMSGSFPADLWLIECTLKLFGFYFLNQ